jgi:putative methyltransferase (TIGR04325 family)
MQEVCRVGPLASLVGRVRKWPGIRQLVNLVAGYNRVFPDMNAARAAARRYGLPGADSEEDSSSLQAQMTATRPSDYPVLFHLSRLPLEGLRVFDLGGTLGNLFYLYDRYLTFPASLRWTVHDLPRNMGRGREYARQRDETRIHFAEKAGDACGHDLLLVSGALHYFEFDLPDFLAGLAVRPRGVLVNRTPLVKAPTAATVQFAYRGVMVACRLLNRSDLVTRMTALGYELVDTWRAPEFSIKLPYDPDYWVKEYTGLYFRTGYRDTCDVTGHAVALGQQETRTPC